MLPAGCLIDSHLATKLKPHVQLNGCGDRRYVVRPSSFELARAHSQPRVSLYNRAGGFARYDSKRSTLEGDPGRVSERNWAARR